MNHPVTANVPSDNSKKGFSLIELIVVIAILGVITAIVIMLVRGYLDDSKKKVCEQNRRTLQRVYLRYKAGDDTYNPDGTTGLQFLIDGNYIDEGYTICPSGGDIYWKLGKDGNMNVYCTVHAEDESDLLFGSDFNNMENISVLMGGWNTVDGKLVPTKSGENRAIFKGTNGTDYNVKLNAVYLSGNAGSSGYGTYYRATDTSKISGYCFQYDPGIGNDFVVRKVSSGNESAPIQRVDMQAALGKNFKITDPHDIEIDVVGDKHLIKVDGVKIMEFTDSTYKEGSVGVRTWSDSKVEINEVVVTKK